MVWLNDCIDALAGSKRPSAAVPSTSAAHDDDNEEANCQRRQLVGTVSFDFLLASVHKLLTSTRNTHEKVRLVHVHVSLISLNG